MGLCLRYIWDGWGEMLSTLKIKDMGNLKPGKCTAPPTPPLSLSIYLPLISKVFALTLCATLARGL